MKNYPNQASDFQRIRRMLALIAEMNEDGRDASKSSILGYAAAELRIYTFRSLGATATDEQIASRIAIEHQKKAEDQGVLTFARELRRTLRDMGWLDENAIVTEEGRKLLNSELNSVEEQALLVEGLLEIVVTEKDGSNPHHPIPVLLKLLAASPSVNREGLELALEPNSDSDSEMRRVLGLYALPRADRIKQLGITDFQRANGVKIFPPLAVQAGLAVQDGDVLSLSQDGWSVIGLAPASAKKSIGTRRGRRTTVGKLVTPESVAGRSGNKPPKTLSAEEQARAAERLNERTSAHQQLVKRMAVCIGEGSGQFFEDEFSYDLLWVPTDTQLAAILFEMKTIVSNTDAYARVRDAVGQLSYYDYFHVGTRVKDRRVKRVAVFDYAIPGELADYMEHEEVAAVAVPASGKLVTLNPRAVALLAVLLAKPAAS